MYIEAHTHNYTHTAPGCLRGAAASLFCSSAAAARAFFLICIRMEKEKEGRASNDGIGRRRDVHQMVE
jgi:hypothetical protein